MFQAIRSLTINAQLGPYDTFEEFQAAASREMPGVVLTRVNATSGQIKDAFGNVTGSWNVPFQLTRKVTFNSYLQAETFEELQATSSKEAPGTVLHPANPKVDKHSGEITDAQGMAVGKWNEI